MKKLVSLVIDDVNHCLYIHTISSISGPNPQLNPVESKLNCLRIRLLIKPMEQVLLLMIRLQSDFKGMCALPIVSN